MAYSNLPPSLQEIFYRIADRVAKLETGPNQAMYKADAAQTDATQALADAAIALADAADAYALASTAIQGSTNTILNASNQLTAINGNGITVYAGSSSTSGARVVLNSAGIAGFDVYGNSTFAVNASTGSVSITGALVTGGKITGAELNIGGNFVVSTSGLMTATGATVTGTITSSNLNANGGTIGGWTINPYYLSNGSTYLYTDTADTFYSFKSTRYISTTAGFYSPVGPVASNLIGSSVSSSAGWTVQGTMVPGTVSGSGQDSAWSIGSASFRWNYIYSSHSTINTSDARIKNSIEPSALGLNFINALNPVSFKMNQGTVEHVVDDKGELIFTPVAGKRRHYGFIAQEVKETIESLGLDPALDFAGWTLDDANDPDSRQGLVYDYFISPLVKAVQELSAKVDKLEGK